MFLLVSSGCCSLLGGCVASRRSATVPLLIPELPIDHVNRLRLALRAGNNFGLERHLLHPGCGDSDFARSIFIRRTFSAVQKATSVSAPASPSASQSVPPGWCCKARAADCVSLTSTAAFHCSSGANIATFCAGFAAACCALAVPPRPTLRTQWLQSTTAIEVYQ